MTQGKDGGSLIGRFVENVRHWRSRLAPHIGIVATLFVIVVVVRSVILIPLIQNAEGYSLVTVDGKPRLKREEAARWLLNAKLVTDGLIAFGVFVLFQLLLQTLRKIHDNVEGVRQGVSVARQVEDLPGPFNVIGSELRERTHAAVEGMHEGGVYEYRIVPSSREVREMFRTILESAYSSLDAVTVEDFWHPGVMGSPESLRQYVSRNRQRAYDGVVIRRYLVTNHPSHDRIKGHARAAMIALLQAEEELRHAEGARGRLELYHVPKEPYFDKSWSPGNFGWWVDRERREWFVKMEYGGEREGSAVLKAMTFGIVARCAKERQELHFQLERIRDLVKEARGCRLSPEAIRHRSGDFVNGEAERRQAWLVCRDAVVTTPDGVERCVEVLDYHQTAGGIGLGIRCDVEFDCERLALRLVREDLPADVPQVPVRYEVKWSNRMKGEIKFRAGIRSLTD